MRQTAVLLLGALPLLAGCAQPDANEPSHAPQPGNGPVVLGTHAGLPDGLTPARKLGQPVAAISGPGRLVLTTWGSSSCPSIPVRAERAGAGALRVILRDAA